MEDTITIQVTTGVSDALEPVEIPRRIGHVRIQDTIGAGASGVVCRAHDEMLGRPVAVKFLHRYRNDPWRQVEELVQGLRSAASVKHPHVVTVYAVERVAGMPAILMELIQGVSMRTLLRSGDRPSVAESVFVMRAVTSAVAALHEAQVLHRDLKPANILFDNRGDAHVCDFGLACDFGASPAEGGVIAGSPLYMPPEAFEGQASPQSDVYALGVMLFEMLAGRPPFQAATLSDLRACHAEQDPPLSVLERTVSDDLLDVVRRCLHKRRMLRYKTAGHLLTALRDMPPAPAEEAGLRRCIAQRVVQAEGTAPGPSPDADPTAHTMFELVAERARRKRARRESD